MPTFILIDPEARTVRKFAASDYKSALREAGLESGGVDFATLSFTPTGGTISIIVYEFGLLDDRFTSCFALGANLYVGPAVLFQADDEGETIDFIPRIDENMIRWIKDKAEAESLMQLGTLVRPQSAVNGEIVWQWRHPLPNREKMQ